MAGVLAIAAPARAQGANGYMAFLPTQTSVTAGTAESYMRAGRDWDGTLPPGATIAQPTLIVQPVITTWKQASNLHLRFVIPDATRVKSIGGELNLISLIVLLGIYLSRRPATP